MCFDFLYLKNKIHYVLPIDIGFNSFLILTIQKQEARNFLCNGTNYINKKKKNIGMNDTSKHDERIAKLTFASVYPHYVNKVENKNRTKEELHQVIEWLTGFDYKMQQSLLIEKVTFEVFFQRATLNPNAHLIAGLICGYRIEEIENPLTQKIRYLDKLVDELAKGRKMEKILRK